MLTPRRVTALCRSSGALPEAKGAPERSPWATHGSRMGRLGSYGRLALACPLRIEDRSRACGSTCKAGRHFRARIEPFQRLAAPFPGDSRSGVPPLIASRSRERARRHRPGARAPGRLSLKIRRRRGFRTGPPAKTARIDPRPNAVNAFSATLCNLPQLHRLVAQARDSGQRPGGRRNCNHSTALHFSQEIVLVMFAWEANRERLGRRENRDGEPAGRATPSTRAPAPPGTPSWRSRPDADGG